MASNYRLSTNTPLSGKQRGILGMLYSKAYQRAVAHYATDDMSDEDWRHAQCRRMAGVTIKDATQAHFLRLKCYGEDLCGNSGMAFATALQMPCDEARRIKAMVEQAMDQWGLNWGYMAAVAKSKFGHTRWDDLSPHAWEQLLYTANNRGKALDEHKSGHWDGSRRNKSQRRKA